MKGTIRITTIIAGITCILLLTCCKHEANYRSDLLRADSVMDARPDSAYGIVVKVRPDSLDEANRALLCLLSTQAKWKTFQDVKQDTAWDEAIRHFTGQKDYDRLAKCYYYRGIVWKEHNEVDKAMKDYLSAAEYIEKTQDNYYNNLINSYIGHLYMDQLAYDKTPKYLNAAYRAAETMNDSLGMAYALMDMCDYYSCCKQSKRSIINAQKAFKLIRCDTTNKFYIVIANNLANAYYYLKDYQKSLHYALQILPMYSKDSISDNGPYYASLAQIYFALKKYNEAKKYYLKSLNSPNLKTVLVAYEGLHNVYDTKSERKLAAYYKTHADSLTQVIYDQNKSDALVQAQSEHKSQKLVNLVSSKNAKTIRGILYILILFAFIAIWAFIKKRKAREKYEKEKIALLAHTEEEHEQNIDLKNAITGIKGVHSMLAAGELAEARVFLQTMLKHPKKIKDWEQHDWKMNNCIQILLFVMFPIIIEADVNVDITGRAKAQITYEPIPYASVLVLDKDSTMLASGTTTDNTGQNPAEFHISGVPCRAFYILKLSCVGYKTTFVDIALRKKRNFVDLGNVVMKPLLTQLKEVEVKATKIKMVVRNDTVIYNADAFQLAEGSMLDNLVKQLPGVKINEAGQITVNGRFVSSLLLNGNDFLKGDPKVALENLPAYMVGKVKVYEKERGDAYLMRNRNDEDKDLVMDVNLKRQYSVGFIGNVEAGGGTRKRYLGRLFGLRHTDHSRLGFYANVNNLNQNQSPGTSGSWSEEWSPSGLTALKMGGMDLQINDKKGVFQLSSNLNIRYEDADEQRLSTGVTFFPDYDRYTFGRNVSKERKTGITSSHELTVKKPYLWSKFKAEFAYYHNNDKGLEQGAEFGEKVTERHRGEVLDSLFAQHRTSSLAAALINSHQEKNLKRGDEYTVNLYEYISLRDFKIVANLMYDKTKAKEYSQYGLTYTQGGTDFRNRYIDAPLEMFSYDATARYLYTLPFWDNVSVAVSYTFAGRRASGDRSLYRLDGYDAWGTFDGNVLGSLPSTRDSLRQIMDLQNSYRSRERGFVQTPQLRFVYDLPIKDQAQIALALPLSEAYDKLSYQRAKLDTVVCRNQMRFEPTLIFERSHYGKKSKNSQRFTYNFVQKAPRLVDRLNVRDDSNPLVYRLGNPLLHNEKFHKLEFSHTQSSQAKQRNMGVKLDWEVRLDAIGQSMVYDAKSGVRTYTPRNISGNWMGGLAFNYGQAVDKARHWQLSIEPEVRYNNCVDWVSLSDEESSVRSSVKNLNLAGTVGADYRKDELHLGCSIKSKWVHADSERENFTTINALNISYGVLATMPLPLHFNLSTDLTLYSRSGYVNKSMNRDETVWNIALSRSMVHGNLTVTLDGFDLLGQLSSIRQTLNAQGNTETWYNSIPRYVMLRAIWRLNVKPGKK